MPMPMTPTETAKYEAECAMDSIDSGMDAERAFNAHEDNGETSLANAGYVVVETSFHADYEAAFKAAAKRERVSINHFFPFDQVCCRKCGVQRSRCSNLMTKVRAVHYCAACLPRVKAAPPKFPARKPITMGERVTLTCKSEGQVCQIEGTLTDMGRDWWEVTPDNGSAVIGYKFEGDYVEN